MRLSISGIPERGIEQKLKLPLKLNDIVLKEDVQIVLKIQKIKERVLINGHAEAAGTVSCGRCLKEFQYPISSNFSVEYLPDKEHRELTEHELRQGELDTSYYKDDEIDLENLIREQILLAVPMKPLCKTECLGICPKCGENLNVRLCTCSTKEIDPRLAKLKEFKQSMKKR
jgi:uncharacterized protein